MSENKWKGHILQYPCPGCGHEIQASASWSGFLLRDWHFLHPPDEAEVICATQQYIHFRHGDVHKLVYQKPEVRARPYGREGAPPVAHRKRRSRRGTIRPATRVAPKQEIDYKPDPEATRAAHAELLKLPPDDPFRQWAERNPPPYDSDS